MEQRDLFMTIFTFYSAWPCLQIRVKQEFEIVFQMKNFV